MRVADKLLGYLNRVFNKGPEEFVALRFTYDGVMTWSITGHTLATAVSSGVGAGFSVDLNDHTLASLAADIAGRTGYTVTAIDTERADLSARVLMEGNGGTATAGGDILLGFTSLLWAYMDAVGEQLTVLRGHVETMPQQAVITSASGYWLDEIGSYYKITRAPDESDAQYGPRIVAETLRPRSNNLAIEGAVEAYTGELAKVTDTVVYGAGFPLYNGVTTYNGANNHDADSFPTYGLFDIEAGYDLSEITSFPDLIDKVTGLVNSVRAAGTHLRSLTTSAQLRDAAKRPTESVSLGVDLGVFSEAVTAPIDTSAFEVSTTMLDTSPLPSEYGYLVLIYGGGEPAYTTIEGGDVVLTDEDLDPIDTEDGTPLLA